MYFNIQAVAEKWLNGTTEVEREIKRHHGKHKHLITRPLLEPHYVYTQKLSGGDVEVMRPWCSSFIIA